MVCACATAVAGAPVRLSQYSRHTWTSRGGLPEGSVLAVTVLADGAVVVATEAGPFRFDGLHFMPLPWNRETGGRVAQALASSADTLLVATERALVRFGPRGTSRTFLIPDACGGATRVALSADGVPWISCFRSGVMRLADQALEPVAVPSVTRDLLGAPGGVMWFATDDGLYSLTGAALRHWGEEDGLPGSVVSALAPRRAGGVWVATSRGLAFVDPQGLATKVPALAGRAVGPLLEREDGSLWGGLRPGGLFRLEGARLEEQPAEAEPAWANVSSLSEDAEGSLWVSSSTNGLTRIREGDVRAFGRDEGLTSPMTWSVAFDRQGDAWFATDSSGVWREHEGALTHFGVEAGLGARRALAVTVDAHGVVWVGTQQGGLFHFERGRFVRHLLDLEHPDAAVSAITHGPGGQLIVGTDFGVLREENGRFVPVRAPLRIEVTDFSWASDGTLWVSSSRGLWRLGPGGLERAAPSVRSSVGRLLERPDGSFWASTDDRGVLRLAPGGGLSFCNERLGLPHDNLWSLVDDRRGQLWMSSNFGIWQVPAAQLERCLTSGTPLPPPRVLGAADGMRDRECSGGYQSPAAVAGDGRVLFACVEGAMVIDGARRSHNPLAPPVRIERVQADGQTLPLPEDGELIIGRGRTTFLFSVLSFRNPEAVRARFRLEGYEEAWEEAPADRLAEYTNLPPGHYRFHVAAANEDGVWNEAGAVVAVSVPPRLVERRGFQVAGGLLAAGLLVLWARRREAELKAREALVGSLVAQRTTELERAKNAAEQATRARTEFLTNISHEIRTPLNAVIGAADLLRQTPLTGEQHEYLDIINSSGDGLLALLNDVLDFSKLEAGRMKLHLAPVEVRAVCRRVLETLGAAARKKSLHLELDCPAEVPAWISSDDTRLGQVLLNLAGNAVKFTTEGFVRVSVRAGGPGRLRFEVTDSGIGLTQEQRGRLFQAFSQADASTSRRHGGTGLGLVISERLVNLLGGAIGLESTHGQGSRFWFEVAAPEFPEPVVEALESKHALPPLAVLLVDDNPTNLRVTSELLRRLGMTVTSASSGDDALAAASSEAFGLVLMDLQMPGMDGLEATRQLFERVRPAPFVVALTANAIEEDRQACLRLGMRDYLTKPVRLEALRRVIRQAAAAPGLARRPA